MHEDLTPASSRQLATIGVTNANIPAVFLRRADASKRFWEFFTANIRNRNTRRAYFIAASQFSAWCLKRRLALEAIQPIHVAAYIEHLMTTHAKPSVKQHLAAIRMLFDWLVTGQVIPVNPAHAVRGPKHSVKKGKTSVLTAEEMRTLLDSIDTSKLIGVRDRALIALMGYTFARVGAVIQMKVEDYYIQNRRGWVRLHEKGGKVNELPCHHNLEQSLEEWFSRTGLAAEPNAPLFPTMRHGKLTGRHKMTSSGVLTSLYSFCSQPDCADGAQPFAGLVQGSDGNFYGTTSEGGTHGNGAVFNITPSGALTTLYRFHGTDGRDPYAGLIQATDGNFYGTTSAGGPNNGGTVFKITADGMMMTILHSFCFKNGCPDGTSPLGALVQGTDGNFYGTTSTDGQSLYGTVFKLSLIPRCALCRP